MFFTKRITITKSQIDKLRATRIKNSISAKQIRFYKSKSFDKAILKNLKMNRIQRNIKSLNIIKSSISQNSSTQKIATKLFGERSIVRGERNLIINKFTSLSQTKRLDRIVKQINNKKFKLINYIKHDIRYKETKKYLPKNVSTQEMLSSLDRTGWYYNHKKVILEYNAYVKKHGRHKADNSKYGFAVRKVMEDDPDYINFLQVEL